MAYRFASQQVEVTYARVMSSIYADYIGGIKRRSLDGELRFPRQKAMAGALGDADYQRLASVLDATIGLAAEGGGFLMEDGTAGAYGRVQVYKLLVAQILFVDRLVKHGFHKLIAPDPAPVIQQLKAEIERAATKNTAPIAADEARFYAVLFVFQVAFDELFVPHEDAVRYVDARQGRYERTTEWAKAISYLTYTNWLIVEASSALRELCYKITTGWSRGIDRATWDARNRKYYEAFGETSSSNVFAKHYDVVLERLLPQFAFSKIMLAEDVVRDVLSVARPVRVLEVGAGSGAFSIDLLMAARRLGLAPDQVQYLGLEPSAAMRGRYAENFARKTGATPPAGWELKAGSLEELTASPEAVAPQTPNETWVVFSYCLHHCYADSVAAFFGTAVDRRQAARVYALDVVVEHGWLKPFYTWADCESPENFDNIHVQGDWEIARSWSYPQDPIDSTAVTNAWCCCRLLVPPR